MDAKNTPTSYWRSEQVCPLVEYVEISLDNTILAYSSILLNVFVKTILYEEEYLCLKRKW